MKIKFLLLLFTILCTVFIFIACEKDHEHTSQNGETESHNMGQNCMNCHSASGNNEHKFYIAGTVYDSTKTTPLANGKVEFYDAVSGGNLVLTLEVDGNGNFYTTNNINFGNGLHPKVISPNGQVKEMGSLTSNGGCGSCHGANQPRIWVNN